MIKLAKNEIFKKEEILRIILEESELETVYYKEAGGEKLKLLLQKPQDWKPTDKRTAILWIHGGAWAGGEMEYLNPHCRYFALRGTVNFNVFYRLMESKVIGEGSTILTCLEDCKSAVKYIRRNAEAFGIDPEKIVVAGDSAGAHLACCLGTTALPEASEEGNGVSYVANAIINCNGIVDLTTKYKNAVPTRKSEDNIDEDRYISEWMEHRELAMKLSPLFNIKLGQPPVLNMHGLSDETVEPEQSLRYHEKCKEVGIKSDLILYPSYRHAFILFNYKEKAEDVFRAVVDIDEWLCKQGFIQ